MKFSTTLFRVFTILAVIGGCSTATGAWKVDPDFRPLPTFGYAVPGPTVMQTDGKLLANQGRQRLNIDGSLDATYLDPLTGSFAPADRIIVTPSGQLLGLLGGNLLWLSPTGAYLASPRVDHSSGRIAGLAGFLPDGRFIVYGGFADLNGTPRAGVARLNADGSVDPSFDPGTGPVKLEMATDAFIQGFLQSDGKVLLLGSFTGFNGVNYAQLVRLNADGSLDLTFDPGPAIPPLSPFSPHGQRQAVAADSLGRVWRIDNDEVRLYETTDPTPRLVATLFPEAGEEASTAVALHPQAGGAMLIIGNFGRVNNQTRIGMVRLLSDGSIDPTFDPAFVADGVRADQAVYNLRVSVIGAYIYVRTRTGAVVRLTLDGQLDPTFNLPAASPAPATILAMLPTANGGLLIGGRLTRVEDASATGFARLTEDGSFDATFAATAAVSGEVRALAIQPDGKIIAGGNFTHAGGLLRRSLARFFANGVVDPSFNADLDSAASVDAISLQADGTIVVGGNFITVGGISRPHVVGLLANGSIDPGFSPAAEVTQPVRSLRCLPDDKVQIGGSWRLNPNGSLDSAYTPPLLSFTASAFDIAADGATTIGGYATTRTRSLYESVFGNDGSFVSAGYLLYDTSHSVMVSAVLAEASGAVLAGLARAANSRLARTHPDGTLDPTFAPEFPRGSVQTMTRLTDGSILASGNFVGVDGLAYASIMRLQPDSPAPRLANISTRGYVGTGDQVMIAGLFVAGNEPQRVLIRGVAQNLFSFGVPELATDVNITVFRQGENTPLFANESWQSVAETERLRDFASRLRAFPLDVISDPIGSTDFVDSALIVDLPPGGYSIHLRAQTPGLALVEIYDGNGVGANRRLINLSTRALVGVGDKVLIAGFVVDQGTKRLLIRAVGPGISGQVPGTLADPIIELVRQSDHATIATNDNWGDNANAAEIALVTPLVSGLTLANGSADAALLVELPAGSYTVIASGVGDTTGIALVEVYEVP